MAFSSNVNEAWTDMFQDPNYMRKTLFEVKQHKKYYVTFCIETGIDGSLMRLQMKDGSGVLSGSNALQEMGKLFTDLFPTHVDMKPDSTKDESDAR